MTTHYMEEADQLCERVAIVDEGSAARDRHARGAQGAGAGRHADRADARRRRGGRGRDSRRSLPHVSSVTGATACSACTAIAAARSSRRSSTPSRRSGRTVTNINLAAPSLETLFICSLLTGQEARLIGPRVRVSELTSSRAPRTVFLALLRRDVRVARASCPIFCCARSCSRCCSSSCSATCCRKWDSCAAATRRRCCPASSRVSLALAAVQSVTLPMVQDFGWTREIEDRLLAPIPIPLIAAEKIVMGVLQGVIAALVVLPASRASSWGRSPGSTLAHAGARGRWSQSRCRLRFPHSVCSSGR